MDHHASVLSGHTLNTAHDPSVEQWMQEAPPTPYVPPVEMEQPANYNGYGGGAGKDPHLSTSMTGYLSPSPVSPHHSSTHSQHHRY